MRTSTSLLFVCTLGAVALLGVGCAPSPSAPPASSESTRATESQTSEAEAPEDQATESDAPAPKETALISETAALDAALKHAGVSRSQVSESSVDLDDDRAANGDQYYDVDFETAAREYDYDVSAVDGTVLNATNTPND